MTPRPPTPTLFPYTTLFRSLRLPSHRGRRRRFHNSRGVYSPMNDSGETALRPDYRPTVGLVLTGGGARSAYQDRKSTRLNSSHTVISYAVFCLKKKKKQKKN